MKNRKLLIIVSVLLVCTIGIGALAVGFGDESGTTKLPAFLDEFRYAEDPDHIYYQPVTDSKGMQEMPKYKNFTGDLMDIGLWETTQEISIIKDIPLIDKEGRILYKVTAVRAASAEQRKVVFENCVKAVQNMGLNILKSDFTLGEASMLVYMSVSEASSLGYTVEGVAKLPLIGSYMYDPEDDVWYGRAYLAEKYGIDFDYGFYDPIPTP